MLPAFSPTERRVALPLLLMVPFLFAAGVAFGYFVVLDRAVDFLLNFNDDEFNIQVRARDYYSFVALSLLAFGLVFQIPVGYPRRYPAGHHDAAEAARWPAVRGAGDCGPGDARLAGRRSRHDAAR